MRRYGAAIIAITGLLIFCIILTYNFTLTRPTSIKPVQYTILEVPVSIDDDPLSDNQEGFPHKSLTFKTADLCNEETNVMLPRSWKCKEDTTCVKCRAKKIKRYDEVKSHFLPQMKEVSLKPYNKRLPITVMAVNTGQVYLLLNWACSLEHYKIGKPQDLVFIVPTDQGAYDKLKPFGFNMVNPSMWMPKLSSRIGRGYNPAMANVGGHSDINNVLLLASNYLLQNTKFDVIIHDVDQVWVQEGPLPFFAKASKRRDILGMAAPYGHAGGGTNSGLIYFSNTYKARIFLQSVANVAGLKKHSDQTLFNTMFRHKAFHTLSVNHVTETILTRYSGSRHTKVNKDTVLFHAVSINKEEHFKKYGFWFFDKKCSFH